MPSTPKPTLQKSVFQAKYKPELEFYRRLYVAAQKLNGFPLWQTDRLSVTLFNQIKHCSVGIAFESFSYTQDSSNLEQEREHVTQALEVLPAELSVKNFLRFGLRRWYLVPFEESFEALVRILDLKLTSQDDEFRGLVPREVTDSMQVFVCSEVPYGFRIILGPMRNIEIPTHIPFDREHHLEGAKRPELELELTKKYPEVAFYVDIDMFQQGDGLTQENALEFFNKARERVSTMASGITDYVFRVKVRKR